jgi:hypothetical protein
MSAYAGGRQVSESGTDRTERLGCGATPAILTRALSLLYVPAATITLRMTVLLAGDQQAAEDLVQASLVELYRPGLRACDLYEHHFWRHDPTLTIINTPVDGKGFGTACPYFEAIAGWALAVLSGKTALPDAQQRAGWCEEHMRLRKLAHTIRDSLQRQALLGTTARPGCHLMGNS